MSREEAMNALIESSMELRQDDIELGRKLERERIMQELEELLKTLDNKAMHTDYGLAYTLRELIKGEQK